jgi:two-component system OmpR family sensor kinase
LSAVSGTPLPAEIAPIADAVNHLMERLRRALEAERSFAANSAHELRTPVAAALAQIQRLIAEAPEGMLQERAKKVEASLRHLAHLSEKLLQLARAEGGSLLAESPQDLLPVLSHLIEDFRQRTEVAGRLKPDICGQKALFSQIDPDAFAILMRNLIENALSHGPAHGLVKIDVDQHGVIRVINEGPSVPPEKMRCVKKRFWRDGQTGYGSGLGLAIADMIAAGAGGRLDVVSPATGRKDGFEAILCLPKPGSAASSSGAFE